MSSAAHRSIGLLACLALAAGLTACTREDAADGETTTTAAASSSPAPASPSDSGGTESTSAPTRIAAPDVPAPDPRDYPGMNEQTEQGAQQTLVYFWDLAIYAYQSGDTAPMTSLQTNSCSYCTELVDEIDEIHSQGGSWGPTSIVDASLESQAERSDQVQVSYGFQIGEHTERTSAASAETNEGPAIYGCGAQLIWNEGGWKVDGIDLSSVND